MHLRSIVRQDVFIARRLSLYQGEGQPKETRRDFKGANKSRSDERTEFNMRTIATIEQKSLKQ